MTKTVLYVNAPMRSSGGSIGKASDLQSEDPMAGVQFCVLYV